VAAIREREGRRQSLRVELDAKLSVTGGSLIDVDVLADLDTRMTEWRDVLQTTDPAGVGAANRLLRQLLVGRLVLHPEVDHYRFEGVGTLQPILVGSLGTVTVNGVPNARQLEPNRRLAQAD
jgi:hypothetical protein